MQTFFQASLQLLVFHNSYHMNTLFKHLWNNICRHFSVLASILNLLATDRQNPQSFEKPAFIYFCGKNKQTKQKKYKQTNISLY